ncbi:MAG: RNA-binding protein [Candidatus Liptonbacteria bacterium]|nr:RNA-binding protein [Candidatus Liptonbacteria bacterium]
MRLYIGNLSYQTTDDTLRDYFSQAGAVTSASVLKDKISGRSRGFGFVEFESDEDGRKAIEMFNGKEFEGRPLVVNEARPMENRAAGGSGSGSGGGYSSY